MKITNSSLELASRRVATQHREIRESLRTWVGNSRPDFEGRQARPTPEPVRISEAGKNSQMASTQSATDDETNNDPRMQMLIDLIEFLTGRKVKFFNAGELRQATEPSTSANNAAASVQGAGWGAEYDYHESYSESEDTQFAASGVVQTADGKTLNFDLQLSMQRSFSEESSQSIRAGDAVRKKDPLVLNFNGNAAQLTDARFSFDLDSDGQTEQINFVANGSGFLVIDRNHDNRVNNGTELFGPSTGNGFSELAALDDDNNGWIDENDAVYADLRIWTKDATGNDQLATLKDAGVGAIALAHIASPFDLKNAANQLQGQVRSSGVFLSEDGKAGSVQQIDLTV